MRTFSIILTSLLGGLTLAQEVAEQTAQPDAAPSTPSNTDYTKLSEEDKEAHYNRCIENILTSPNQINEQEFKKLIALADSNFPPAIDSLAACYSNGIGVEYNEKKAFELYTQAASLGHAPSAHQLADFCINGIGCDPDAARGVRILQQLIAVKKDYTAAATLGNLYLHGDFGFEDHIAAAAWFRFGMDNGDIASTRAYACCLINGSGVSKNIKEGMNLFQKLIDENQDGASCKEMGLLYWNGLGVKKSQEEAMAWFRKGAGFADIDSSRTLALAYRDAEGDLRKPKIALDILTELAYSGDTASALSAGEMLLNENSGLEKDAKRAYEILSIGMQEGDIACALRLGKGLYYGWDGEQDIKQGLEVLEACANEGNEQAALIIIESIRTGVNPSKTAEPEKAHTLLEELDARGCVGAAYELYLDYKEGRGVDINDSKASEYFKKAQAQGDPRIK